MAFLLAKRLESQLQTKSRLTDDSFNPSNLENFQLPPGVKLPTDWLSFDEQSTDAFIDQMTTEAEKTPGRDTCNSAHISLRCMFDGRFRVY
jgi:hypothetical protein